MVEELKNLQQLKNFLASMGGYVEESLKQATQALIDRNPNNHENVEKIEQKINECHLQVDQTCMNLLAKLSPFASDLRLILACYKMNNDLERMGDHARNISRGTSQYLSKKEIPHEKDFLQLINETRSMVKESLDSFVNKDIEKAKEVLLRDDIVDELKNTLTIQMKELMKKDPDYVESALDFILFARNLERIGDLATNIAEEVIFITSGDDVRHGGFLK
ncbi:MAG: phosphate signaling complex protein PhoU [Bdellovibrionota bacterium]